MKRAVFGVFCLFSCVSAQALDSTPQPGAPFSWTRCYAGVHGGYIWSNSRLAAERILAPLSARGRGAEAGGGFGGQVGCNWQAPNRMVLGLEGEVYGSQLKTQLSYAPPVLRAPLRSYTDVLTANLAVRAGYAFDRTLLYGKIGVAHGEIDYPITFGRAGALPRSGPSERNGWLIGAGVEHAIADAWTIKLEYNRSAFDRSKAQIAGYQHGRIRETRDTLKAGVNFLFDSSPFAAP